MKSAAIIENEIRDYYDNLQMARIINQRKNRGEIVAIEVKQLKDFVANPKGNPDFFVGGFVKFSNGERIFVYRYDNHINKGYGTYAKSFNTDKEVAEIIEGWDRDEPQSMR
jgi:hypothetical protein